MSRTIQKILWTLSRPYYSILKLIRNRMYGFSGRVSISCSLPTIWAANNVLAIEYESDLHRPRHTNLYPKKTELFDGCSWIVAKCGKRVNYSSVVLVLLKSASSNTGFTIVSFCYRNSVLWTAYSMDKKMHSIDTENAEPFEM